MQKGLDNTTPAYAIVRLFSEMESTPVTLPKPTDGFCVNSRINIDFALALKKSSDGLICDVIYEKVREIAFQAADPYPKDRLIEWAINKPDYRGILINGNGIIKQTFSTERREDEIAAELFLAKLFRQEFDKSVPTLTCSEFEYFETISFFEHALDYALEPFDEDDVKITNIGFETKIEVTPSQTQRVLAEIERVKCILNKCTLFFSSYPPLKISFDT